MGRLPGERARRLAAVAIVASFLGAAPVRAEGDPVAAPEAAPPAPSAVAVFSPRAPDVLRAVDGGVRLWIVQALRRGGVPVVDPAHTDAVAAAQVGPDRPFLRGEDAPALAQLTEASALVLSRIRLEDGRLEVWLRAYDAKGAVLAVGRGSGRLASLGEALAQAFAPVSAALGAGPGREPAPRLAELGAFERAMDRIASGALAMAWQELAGIQGPTADALREDIVALAGAPGVAAAERSRLASARGASDPDWLAIRHSLQRERDASALLAGAEHARAGGDPEGALVLFAEAAKASPGNLDAERGRAHMLGSLGRQADARAAWERVLSLAPGDVEARLALAGNPTLAKPEQARMLLAAGEQQAQRLDDDGARACFERAAQIDGDVRAAARRHFARLEESLGNDAEAMAAWDETLAAQAGDLEALGGLGRLRARGGDAAGAAGAFEQVVAGAPTDAAALQGLGDALLAQGRAQEALVHLEKAVAAAPRDARKRGSLARALVATGQPDAALAALDPAEVPLEDRPFVLSQAAEIHAERGQLAEAQSALVRAVALEPDEPPLRSALAKVHAQAGDAAAASAEEAVVAKLSGVTVAAARGSGGPGGAQGGAERPNPFVTLAESFPTHTSERRPLARVAWLGLEEPRDWRARLRAWLLPQAVDPGRLEAAVQNALRARFEIAEARELPEAARSALEDLRALGTERADIALVNDVLAVDAAFVARWLPSAQAGWFDPPNAPLTVELRLLGGRLEGEAFVVAYTATLADPSAYVAWNRRAGIVAAVLALLLLVPLLRGWGTLVVVLDYERVRGAQGFFSIELSRRPGKTKQQRKPGAGRNKRAKYQRKVRSWSRLARHMVERETRMRWLPARSWYVAVHGLLQDTTSQEVIGNYLEERKVRVQRGKLVEVSFDFRRKVAPIEVRLQREENAPPAQARVAVLGAPDSLRFVKDDTATVFLAPGKHTLLVGVEDRVYERVVEVRELVGQSVHVQVGQVEGTSFSGSAEAALAYLSGDLLSASRALERAGKLEAATLVRATHHRLRGESAEAARWFEKAGKFGEAAELAKQSPKAERSAALFEKAGDFHQAAQQHAAAGNVLEAAQAYEAGFEYAAAIDAYRAAGVFDKALDLLEKTGRFYEAGALAQERGEEERAIRCLQLVGVREAEYPDACDALAGLFEKRGAFDLAIDKARAAIDAKGADEAPLDALEGLARLLERAERPAEALAIWENIRKRDFQYAGAGERVEALRQTVAATARATATQADAGAGEVTAPIAPPAPAESRYEVLGELGRGGMGVVLRARDKRLGRLVALKRLPENLKSNATAVQLFLREARAAAALSHPNIVTLFDADQQPDGTYYLTMELLEGFGLDSVVKKRGRLSVRDTLRIGVQIAKGLQFAHEKGVVHRDIKTANLFFTRDRVLKIMDFGLAKMTEEVRRAATVIGGTPYYMAPEQAAGETVDHRADLYALGVTLFELLTGSVPFVDGDVGYHHRHTPPPDPRERVAGVPDALAELILRLLAKSPDARPATTAEVTRSLEQILAQVGGAAAVS
jgi:tRNA A-37 threonylcarbamoyl transferase component Bud32/Flp pilus assembly protein TadD